MERSTIAKHLGLGIVIIGTALLISLSHLGAQNPMPRSHGSIQFHDVTLSQGTLAIDCDSPAFAAHVTLAVQVDPKVPTDRIAMSQLTANPSCPLCTPGTNDWPKETFQFSSGRVEIHGLGKLLAGQNATVNVVLKNPTTLSIAWAHQPIYAGPVVDSLFIADGAVTDKKVKTPLDAIHLTMHMTGPTPDVQKLPNGTYYVSGSNMRSHLLQFTMPKALAAQATDPSACCGNALTATLVISVDPTGTPAVLRASGDPGLAQASSSAVQSWRFSPFIIEGRPAAVTTTIFIIAPKDGTVHIAQMEH